MQALVGVAFSLGFIFGPMIGAAFSVLGKEGNGSSSTMFQYPALFSLTMATLDILLMVLLFKETLPLERRVSQCHRVLFVSDHGKVRTCCLICTGKVTRTWNQWNPIFDQPYIAVQV